MMQNYKPKTDEMRLTDVVGIFIMLVGMLFIIVGLRSTNVTVAVLAQSANGSQSSEIMINLIVGGFLLIISILLMVNNKRR